MDRPEVTTEEIRASYDATPYPRASYRQTSPAHMGMIAAALGVNAAEPARSRLLEIGCACGGNAIPLALAYPGMDVTGIDLSPRQVAEANALARELGLSNIRFEQADIREARIDGPFDYVVAHGVYSWVPGDVREALLGLIGRVLAPGGVAFLSFNARPGHDQARLVRDAMLFHAGAIADPQERATVAARFIDWLAETVPEDTAHGPLLRNYREARMSREDEGIERATSFMLHDELAEVNEGFYLHEVASRAAAHGLAFLADADGLPTAPPSLSADALRRIEEMSTDAVDAEQYLDFLTYRPFRRALFVRADEPVQRPLRPEPRRFARLWASTLAREVESAGGAGPGVVRFRAPDGAELSTDHTSSKAAFAILAGSRPAAIPLAELVPDALTGAGAVPDDPAESAAVLSTLMRGCSYSRSLVDFTLGSPPSAASVGAHPAASPYARYLVRSGQRVVTNLKHQRVELHPVAAALLTLVDGTRDLDGLTEAFGAWLSGPQPEGASLRERVAATLDTFAADALLLPA